MQRQSIDRTLALKVTGHWRQCLVLLSVEAVSLKSDRTLGLRPITTDQTLALKVTGRWRQCLVLLSDEAVSLESDRTLGLRPTRRVRSGSVPYCKRSDAEGPASG